jgi:hypothetical protein
VAISSSARGDRAHSFRITTARQKHQHFCIIKQIGAGADTTSCVSTIVANASETQCDASKQYRTRITSALSKMPMK